MLLSASGSRLGACLMFKPSSPSTSQHSLAQLHNGVSAAGPPMRFCCGNGLQRVDLTTSNSAFSCFRSRAPLCTAQHKYSTLGTVGSRAVPRASSMWISVGVCAVVSHTGGASRNGRRTALYPGLGFVLLVLLDLSSVLCHATRNFFGLTDAVSSQSGP
jgi:hypothetical protein